MCKIDCDLIFQILFDSIGPDLTVFFCRVYFFLYDYLHRYKIIEFGLSTKTKIGKRHHQRIPKNLETIALNAFPRCY